MRTLLVPFSRLAVCAAAAFGIFFCAPLFAAVTVPFAVGSSVLDERGMAALDALDAQVEDKNHAALEIRGYSDSAGSEDYNLALSERRAAAVREALSGRGWPAARMTARPMGSADPAATGDSEAARVLNRRVEITVTPDEPEARLEWFRGGVEYLPEGGARWKPGRKGAPIYRLYRIRVGAGAARLRFSDGSGADVGRDSTLVVYGPAAGLKAPGESPDLELETGELLNRLPDPAARPFRTRTPSASVSARAKAHFISVSTAQLTAAAIYDGEASVAAQGKEVRVEGGYGVSVGRGSAPGPQVKLPSAPEGFTYEALGPAPGGTRARLAWSGAGPLYSLQIAEDTDFSAVYAERRRESLPEFTAELPYGRYWARVTCETPDGLKGPAAVYAFEVKGAVFRELSPAEKRVIVSTGIFAVSGKTVLGARVYHGDRELPAPDGSFSGEFPLARGENLIELKAAAPRGPAETAEYRVLREAAYSRLSAEAGGGVVFPSGSGRDYYSAAAPELGGVLALSRTWELSVRGLLEDSGPTGAARERGAGWAALGGLRHLPSGRARPSFYTAVLGGVGSAPAASGGLRRSALGGLEAGWRLPLPGGEAIGLGGRLLLGSGTEFSTVFRLELPIYQLQQ